MSLSKYPRYKNTGAEWFGDIPEHWRETRLKHVAANRKFSIVDGPFGTQLKAEDYRSFGVPLVRISNLSYEGRFSADDLVFVEPSKANELSRSRIQQGDVIIGKTGATIGKSALYPLEHGLIASSCIKMSPNLNELSPLFLAKAVLIPGFIEALINAGGGSTRDTINIEPFGNLSIPLPPLDEQILIGNFIDRETAKIDALIAEQEKLIALLAEKRQATISHAVTRGLNPNTPMKESGVAWLGEVPAHWKVKRLRFVAKLNPSKSEIAAYDRATLVSFLPMEAIGDDGSLNLERFRPIAEVETGYTYFRDGDVTVAKITPCFENGKGALMQGLQGGIGFGTTELIVARPIKGEVTGELLNWIFRSPNFRQQAESSMYGAGGQKRVPDDFVRDFVWAFPSSDEQVVISEFLDGETQKLDQLEIESRRAMVLLKERRSTLIAAAVTGQIDVRNISGNDNE